MKTFAPAAQTHEYIVFQEVPCPFVPCPFHPISQHKFTKSTNYIERQSSKCCPVSFQVWFQNKRARCRRRAAETGQPPLLPPHGNYGSAAPPGPPPTAPLAAGWPPMTTAPSGGLHLPTSGPVASLLMPQSVYPAAYHGHPHVSGAVPSAALFPQLQSLYGMDPASLLGYRNGLSTMSHLPAFNWPLMRLWTDPSKHSSNQN